MTPRERTRTVLKKNVPDRLPREIKLTPPLQETFEKQTGAKDVALFYDLEVREVYFRLPKVIPDFSRYYGDNVPPMPNPRGWEVGEWGVGQRPGSMLHFIHIENPMKNITSLSELKKYPFPDMTAADRHEHLEAEVASLHDDELFVIGYMEWTIFEIAWHMRGMEQLFVDMTFDPAFAEYLLERITAVRCFQAKRFAEAGVDMIRIGDDLGTQRAMLMSPETYRAWFKPRHGRVIEAARNVNPGIDIQYHSDGNCWDVIGDLVDIGVTVLNPVQPECLDLKKVKREFGRDLCFWGGIGTQTTMPFCRPREVYKKVQETVDILGPTGGFVPSPTHVLEPEVPWDNVEAYLKAAEEYRFRG